MAASTENRRERKRDWNRANSDAINARQREKYANDPAYRERCLAQTRAYVAANEVRVKEYDRLRTGTPSRQISARDRHLRQNYGITAAQWNVLFESQGSKCAICSTTEPGWHRGWHTDHCHETREIRGILCANCNHGVGKFQDDPQRLIRAAEYLTKKGVHRA